MSYLGHLIYSRMRFETCSHLTTWKYKIFIYLFATSHGVCHSLKMWIVYHSSKNNWPSLWG